MAILGFGLMIGCGETIKVQSLSGSGIDRSNPVEPIGRIGSSAPSEHLESDEPLGCRSDFDCAGNGSWQRCVDAECVVEPISRTLRLGTMTLEEPGELNATLGAALKDLTDSGDLNLLIHLGQSEHWLVQGVESGSVDGEATYGQSPVFGGHRGEAQTECTDGVCSTEFSPDSHDNRLTIYVPGMSPGEENVDCPYQVLELIDVSIEVSVDVNHGQRVESSVRITGLLPEGTASDFAMKDGQVLVDILERNGMEMNDRSTDGEFDGWRLSFLSDATEVFFDNDPGAHFEDSPRSTTGRWDRIGNCR